jgi:hypothetical protein
MSEEVTQKYINKIRRSAKLQWDKNDWHGLNPLGVIKVIDALAAENEKQADFLALAKEQMDEYAQQIQQLEAELAAAKKAKDSTV